MLIFIIIRLNAIYMIINHHKRYIAQTRAALKSIKLITVCTI